MSQQAYNWKRFWCPRSSQIDLGDRGFLTDPESDWGKRFNPDLVDLEAIANIPCLVLLGEPGIGKSQEMDNLKKYTEANTDDSNEVLELNLRSCTNLKDDLFRNEQFVAWKEGKNLLYLFLDSLDEGLLQIQNLAAQLVDGFKRNEYRDKFDRLYIRLACRTAVFPNFLEDELKKLWEETNFKIYELSPLRRNDVQQAVTAQGLDADVFLNEIDRKGVTPFAIKPITLRFLVNTFRKNNGRFPSQQKLVDLYLDGCKSLCEEQNSSRRASKQIGKFEVSQRLIVAARIAVITVFANRFAVWTETNAGNVPNEDVLLEELLGDEFTTNQKKFPVTRGVIEEVLDTGLFSSRGSNRMGWAHQSYAEFLAAWFLTQHDLHPSQTLGLIYIDRRVIPQLHETAAWLASMMPEVFQEIMQTDPDILLHSDISTIDNDNKAKLVESLLKAYNDHQLSYYNFRPGGYRNLKYPDLCKQLKKYICDPTWRKSSQYAAVSIAEACEVKEIQEDLVNLILDSQRDYQVRVRALRAACHLCNGNIKSRLKPLAIHNNQHDPDDDLKGYALEAIYPNYISTREVLNNLKSPSRSIIGGSYQDFLAETFAERLPLDDLSIALNWLEKQPGVRDLNYPFNHLSDSILQKAWENIEYNETLLSFSKIVLLRIQEHDAIAHYDYEEFKQEIADNDSKRHKLIDKIISMIPESDQETWFSFCDREYNQLVVQKQDFPWLINQLKNSKNEHIQNIYAKLIRQTLNWKDADSISRIIEFDQRNHALKSVFQEELAPPIELDSQQAEQLKAQYEALQRSLLNRSSQRQKTPLEPPPKQRLIDILDKIELGHPELWWELCAEMTLTQYSNHYDHYKVYKSDITEFPGWQEADAKTKSRIIETAKHYLIAGNPESHAWMETNQIFPPPFAGYQALYLLLKLEPEFIPTLPEDIWRKWVPSILALPDFSENDDIYQQLLEISYRQVSDEFIRVLLLLIDKENRISGSVSVIDRVRKLWNERISGTILEKAKDTRLKPKSLRDLLYELLEHSVGAANVFASSLICLPLLKNTESRQKAVVAASLLILFADNSHWSNIWAAIREDTVFGQEVLESIEYYLDHKTEIKQKLSEDHLADLYIFLSQEYSEKQELEDKYDENTALKGITAHVAKNGDTLKRWKNYIPSWLEERGTSDAYEALRRIIHELPELADDLQWHLIEAESAVRRNTWNPLEPEKLLQLLIRRDPLNLDLSNQLNLIDQRTKKMEDEPKIENNITISNSSINAPVGTSGETNSQVTISDSDSKKGINWGNWLAVIGILVAMVGIPLSMSISGAFNEEFKQWFKHTFPAKVEQKSIPKE